MLIVRNALAKTLAKSQKITFMSKNIALNALIFRSPLKMLFRIFFFFKDQLL